MVKPTLSQAHVPLVAESHATDAQGRVQVVHIPEERPLTIYVNRRELVTLMTLGAHAEWLVLGWLRNQRLALSLDEIHSIQVDWEVSSAAVVADEAVVARWETASQQRLVTTGCGQGSVFGDLMAEIDKLVLPDARISQARLYGVLNAIRLQETTYKSAGSVHGCALFSRETMQIFVEDVGRHNAIDTIAGWMWMHGVASDADSIFYTTGRLTSEMVMKSAQMGVAVVVSRSGITQMGYDLAARLQLCAIGRATNKHFLCYTAAERLQLDPALAQGGVQRVVAA
mgnify:CR=1 FL=1